MSADGVSHEKVDIRGADGESPNELAQGSQGEEQVEEVVGTRADEPRAEHAEPWLVTHPSAPQESPERPRECHRRV